VAVSRKKSGTGGWFLFWLAFAGGILFLFALNLERIKTTVERTGALEFLAQRRQKKEEAPESRETPPEPLEAEALPPEPEAETAGEIPPEEAPDEGPSPENPRMVNRLVYLLKVDNTGAILWNRVARSLPASDTPMRDALNALIEGPSAEEEKRGFISLIPRNTRILSAAIRDGTAYIDFNEDFLFNTFGVEGYIGQRRQVVLTATEFSTVRDVQILIEGRRVDYLGEGIWIGSPINREML
jgi:hypothetical protein